MRVFSFLLVLTISIAVISPDALPASLGWAGPDQLTMQKESQVIDQRLVDEYSSLPSDANIPVFIFFTDKGIFDQASYYDALNSCESNLTEAARERRMKTRGLNNLADFQDLPVNNNYIDNVLATGAQLRQTLRWFNAISVNATLAQVDQISRFGYVRYIKRVLSAPINDDLPVGFSQSPSLPEISLVTLDYGQSQNQLNQINVIPAHELGFKGQNVIICMHDVGYWQEHSAFQPIITSGRLLAQYDFINHDNNTNWQPGDDSAQVVHGTLTWSTLGGESSGHLYGPSYLANFILAKTEDITSERHIEEDNWAAGALWADSIGASVISSSLGYRDFDPDQQDYQYSDLDGHTAISTLAAALAARNGITVCNAMGNEGYYGDGSLIAPADADSILSCGAVDGSGIIAGFSSLGPTYDGRIKPEVCAQGVNTSCAQPYAVNGFTAASGTSLSTPLVGGSSGVLLSAHPNWTPVMVREALMMTADRFDTPDNTYGSGIMDVSRALYYHPQNDILITHFVAITAASNVPITVSPVITGRGGMSIAQAYLYYRIGNSGDFTEIAMNSGNRNMWSGQIPGDPGPIVQYYIKAVDMDSTFAFDPIGGAMHPYTVNIGATQFTDSFEDGPIYWRTGGTLNTWGLTVKYTRTGNLSMSDSPNTNYRDNANSWMESAFILDLTNASDANLSFYWRGILQSGHDTIFIETSIDNGATWNRQPQFLTGTITTFTQVTSSLSALLGQPSVKLRFRLFSDASGRREGAYFDDISINWAASGMADNPSQIPGSFSLSQNYPNPFNPSTSILFSIPQSGKVNINVFDLLGRHVKTLVSNELGAGDHEIIWNGTDDGGHPVSSGVYMYKLESGNQSQVRRMTLVR